MAQVNCVANRALAKTGFLTRKTTKKIKLTSYFSFDSDQVKRETGDIER